VVILLESSKKDGSVRRAAVEGPTTTEIAARLPALGLLGDVLLHIHPWRIQTFSETYTLIKIFKIHSLSKNTTMMRLFHFLNICVSIIR
jgi:hypothetical protein